MSAADVADQIRSLLALSIPDLDTSVGAVAGKMVDAFSVPAAEAGLDQHLTTYQYDIDSKTAGDLETFCRLFGINRKAARYATGVVTFGRTSKAAALGVATIPVGTRVMSNTNPVIYVQTTASAVMNVNQTTVDVPVQAIDVGSVGNVAAGTLVLLASDTSGVGSATTNTLALVNGRDAESDDTLRQRWKDTVFRNYAGTEQMYRAVAFDALDAITAVNVIGPKKTWVDRITIASGTSGVITFGNPEYIYASGVFVGPDLGSGELLSPRTDYSITINNNVSPATIKIDSVVGGVLADGDYDLSFDYVPTYSRNNPFGTRFGEDQYVNNRVDVWMNGSDPIAVTQECKWNPAALFSSDPTNPLYLGNYQTLDGTHPAAGDYFVPLGFCPIISMPNDLVIGATTWDLGHNFDIVHRSDAFGYSPSSEAGLLWHTTFGAPVFTPDFTVNYVYNRVPATVQKITQGTWRLLGTDVQFHAAIVNQYRFHLAVVYDRGFDITSVNTAINQAISTLVSSLGFDSSLQVSDVLQAAHNVAGVDNVRFLNSSDDGTHYAIEQMTADGASFSPVRISQIGGRAADLYFDDAHIPQFHSTRILTKTRTNFGVA